MSTNTQICGRVCSALSFLLVVAIITAIVISPAFAQSAARITQPIDENVVVTLTGNTRPEVRNPKYDRGRVSDGFYADHMWLLLQRSPQQEQQMEKLIDSLNDHNSSNFHHWLTPEQYGEYGVAKEDIDTITTWLESHGFTVNQAYPNHMLIDFSGTAGQLRGAFHVDLHNLEVNGKQHVANVNDPSIPAALAPVVKGIVTLNDFKPHPMYKVKPDYTFAGCASSADVPTEPGTCYAVTPQDNAVIYNLNPLWNAGYSGQGQTIVVLESTDMYNYPGDWNTYRTAFGLTGYPGTLSQIHPGGCGDPGAVATDGEEAEANLDVEVASGFAPSAAIELASCTSGTFGFGGQVALVNILNGSAPYPGVISMSYGSCEVVSGQGMNAMFSATFQQAAAQGVSMFVSSGDEGPSSCSDEFGVEYDLTSLGVTGWGETPYNVAVGGTDFEDVYDAKIVNTEGGQTGTVPLSTYWSATNGSTYGSAQSYVPEIPWNNSCASALIADYVKGSFATAGSTGFCNESPGNSTSGYIDSGAGSGGPSNCATGSPANSTDYTDVEDYLMTIPNCQGYPKPSFQSGASLTGGNAVYGQPADGVRDIPDVSLFAANGVWGHFETICWSNTSDSAYGGASCSGAPSTWSGFGGTSVASPAMAAIQALTNQFTGESWGSGVLQNYYQMGQNEYGTAGGTFVGSSCNSSVAGGPASSCVFNDVTQGDIDLACEFNGTTEEAHCYPSNESPSYNSGIYGVDSTDNVTAVAIVNGGYNYTSTPTCTIAAPSNLAPYISPTGTTLWAGGSTATCTAATNSGTTTAIWTVKFEDNPSSDSLAGMQIAVGGVVYTFVSGTPTAANEIEQYTSSSASTNETNTAKNMEAVINDSSSECASSGCVYSGQTANPLATATESTSTVTLTAKGAGYANNFNVNLTGSASSSNESGFEGGILIEILNTTIGQGPNYVSSISITGAGSGYDPETPITISGGGGSGAVAIANTSPGTAAQSYQPTYGAAPGWDMATGLGSPNALNLVCNGVWGTSCPIATSTAVSSNANPSTYGESVTFTAAVTSGGNPVAGGMVQFVIDSNNFGSPVSLNSSGKASVSDAVLGVGNHTITASVVASALDQTSSGSLSGGQTVNMATTSINVTSVNPASEAYGQDAPTTITAVVSWTGSGTAPTAADVTIGGSGLTGSFSATSCGSPSGDSMTCTATYTPTQNDNAGTYTMSATFSGDSNYSGSTSPQTGNFSIGQAGSGTITVSCLPDPSTYGASVTCTATIPGQYGAITHRHNSKGNPLVVTGTVTWSSNTGCGTTNVTSGDPGTAMCTTSILPTGSDTVTANYSGDSNHNPGSGSTSQTVNQTSTSISVTNVAPASEEYGADSTVTITAQLTWTGSGTAPTSSDVTIGGSGFAGTFGSTMCSAPSGDSMTCTNTYTPSTGDNAGSYTFTASFSGDSNYSASASSQTNNFTITSNQSTTTVMSNQNPSTYGTAVTFTATITSDTGAVKGNTRRKNGVKSLQVTGTVTWSSNTGCSPSSVSDTYPGTATCTTSILPVGTDTITASYSGDSDHSASMGTLSGGQVVNSGAPTSISVTNVSPSSEIYGQDSPVNITAVLSWTGNGAAPTASDISIGGSGFAGSFGTINCGSPSGDTITCNNTYTPTSGDAVGSYTFTASFSGDSNYAPSSSSGTNNFSITQATSTTGVVGNPNPSVYGTSVTFTATIDGEYGAVKGNTRRKNGVKSQAITGTVSWSSNTGCGTTNVTTNPDGSGTATCTTSASTRLPVGTDVVTATYSGDSNHTGSTGSENQMVTGNIATTISVTNVSPSSEDFGADTPVTITAQLTWTGNGKEPTKANVTIGGNGNGTYGATSCGTRSGDSFTCTATYTPTTADGAGQYTETATFSGDSNYAGSTSSQTDNFTINQATSSTSVVLTTGANPSTYGNSLTFTATVDGENGAVTRQTTKKNGVRSQDITGTVTWSSNTGCAQSTVSGYPGTATCTTTALPGGTDTVTANYSGDSNHSGSSGSVSQTVKRATQTITAVVPPGVKTKDSFTVAASTSSGLQLTFTSTNDCSNSGATYKAGSVAGTCSGEITQSGNGNYVPTQYSFSVPVLTALVAPAVSLTGAPANATYGTSFTVTATYPNTEGVPIEVPTITAAGSCTAGAASGSGTTYQSTITMTKGTGTCTAKATWAANFYYAKATAEEKATAELVIPTYSLTGAPTSEPDGQSFVVTATSNETGSLAATPTIKVSGGDCSVGSVTSIGSGSYQATVTMTKATGTCTTTATWDATDEYAKETASQMTTAEPAQ